MMNAWEFPCKSQERPMVRVNAYMVVTTLEEQLLLGITFVEPRPRAPDTIMNYSSKFITDEVFVLAPVA